MAIKNVIKKIPGMQGILKKRYKRRWRKNNLDNFTTIGKYLFDQSKVLIGKGTYGELNIIQFERTCGMVKIGNFCSIAPNVTFITDGEHAYNTISTYPFASKYLKKNNETLTKGDIEVGDDVWICYGSTILSGVNIGQGAIVAAGAVVTKDVAPYAIVAGVPAKVIKYRFESALIEDLLKIDYSKLSLDIILKNREALYMEFNSSEQLDWLPQK